MNQDTENNKAGPDGSGENDDRSLGSYLPIDDLEEEISEGGKMVRRRGVYLLPNLFTTAALFFGFFAVVAGMQQQFEAAAIAVFVAMLFDGLDGRVARLTHTQSKFGVEYDSLSDLVSFGVAPSLVMYSWALKDLGKFGWAAAFIYLACAALRLARFNTQVETADKNYFAGLASPPAAAVLASIVWVAQDEGWVAEQLPFSLAVVMAVVTATVGILMIVNVKYHSFKGLDLRGRVPFAVIFALVLVIGLVTVDPARVLLAAAVLYALSGPVGAVYRKLRGVRP